MTSFTPLSILNLEATIEKIAGSNRMQIKSSHAIRATESCTPGPLMYRPQDPPWWPLTKTLCPHLPWPHIVTSLLLAAWQCGPLCLSHSPTSVPPLCLQHLLWRFSLNSPFLIRPFLHLWGEDDHPLFVASRGLGYLWNTAYSLLM